MKNFLPALILSFFAMNAYAVDSPTKISGPAVKKSSSGICHDQTSRFYGKVKRFTPYDNLKTCLDSGGQAPAKKAKV